MATDHQTAIRITHIALSRADGDRIANNIYVRILDDQAELYKTSLAVGATKLNQWQISFDVPGPCFTVHVMQQRRFRRSDYDIGSVTVVPADFSTREAGCICKKTFGSTSQGNPTGIEVFFTFVGIRATSPVQTRLASTLPEPAMQHSSVRRSVEVFNDLNALLSAEANRRGSHIPTRSSSEEPASSVAEAKTGDHAADDTIVNSDAFMAALEYANGIYHNYMPEGGDRADSSYDTDLPGLADLPPAIKRSLAILAKVCKDDSLVTSQAERDASVQKLGISVRSALQSLVVVDDWAKNPLVRDTVGSVLETIVECINFLNVYSKNIQAGDTASSIQRWQEALDEFVSKFDLSVPIRSVEKVQLDEFPNENALLEKLPHAANVHYEEGRSCLFGTQEDILRIISQWIDLQAPNRNVLWLHGIAGSGKTTIAATVAAMLVPPKLPSRASLGADFFCQSDVEGRFPQLLWLTIAYRLARTCTPFRRHIIDALRDSLDSIDSSTDHQFAKFIAEPMSKLVHLSSPPVVIIIDALDTCGDPFSRKKLIRGLVKQSIGLPSWLKFLITSRPRSDIKDLLGSIPDTLHLNTLDEAQRAAVASYIRHHLKTSHLKPGEQRIEALISRAGGLFSWAQAALLYIQMQTNQDRAEHYVLSGTSSCAPWLYIDEVYREVLRELLPFDIETDRYLLCHDVLGLLTVAKAPLTSSNLCRLLCDSPAESDIVEWFIGELASILPIDSSGAIRVHSSFIDFLTSENRSQEFFVDTSWCNFCMARNCLTILLRELGQSQSIDSLLFYGRFWIDHLVDSRHIDGADILQCLTDILENHPWEWWELLSLSGDIKNVLSSLRRFGDWYRRLVPISYADTKLALIEDTIRFFSVMQNYSLDLYVCMLMSTPQTIEFVQHYGPLALCSLMSRSNITSRCASMPPGYAILFTTVAFSPIGDLVAFGSQTGTVLVYFAKTRTEKWSSNVDSKQPIHSLKFSAKGGTQLVAVSGDWAIQIWDVETGVLVALLDGHRGAIRSVAFSPDGAFIASVSDDASLRIWDAQEYSELFCFRDEELGIRAVTFSPDGRYIASGSDDGFVRILEWHPTINTATELRLLDTSIMPYGGSLGPESLAFLPGGSRGWPWRIAVVRNVATVWDIFTREMVARNPPLTESDDSWQTVILGDRWVYASYEECKEMCDLPRSSQWPPFPYCLKLRRLVSEQEGSEGDRDDHWVYIPFYDLETSSIDAAPPTAGSLLYQNK